ncbi:MAG: HD-GYP domain-containing protein [Erysipelotrichaceae bacterium]|nr:MAG: HD-GYP domain-containing [Erysipelotrichaceae bacterium]TXT16690.1 MAG: HD-GYP domain-containing protein [Erysipelotrichaceae bacterium]
MNFSLNEFLISVSNTLDAIETDLFGVPTNHSKRIAYIATRIAHKLMLKPEEIFDLAALSLMHDNGATMKILDDKINYTVKQKIAVSESRKEHCLIGEANLKHFPFLTNPEDIIKYHHEDYNGGGFFGLSGDDIPLFAQIIHISDNLDLKFDLNHTSKELLVNYIVANRNGKFSIFLSDIVLDLMDEKEFWEDLKDENIKRALEHQIPLFANALSFKNIRQITHTLSRIIDAKSILQEGTQQDYLVVCLKWQDTIILIRRQNIKF